jgi:hypothetical protein
MSVINDIFYMLIERKTLVLELGSSEYESTRVQLVRKLSRYKDEMGRVGFLADWIRDSSLSGSYDAEGKATFKLAAKRPQKQYTILSTGNNDDQETTPVRTDLVGDQECQVWDMGFFENPQLHEADADSSSPQGESSPLCNPSADRGAYSRPLGDEGGAVPEEQGLPYHQL